MKQLFILAMLGLAACAPVDPGKRASYDATLEARVDTCVEGADVEVLFRQSGYEGFNTWVTLEVIRECDTGCVITNATAKRSVSTDISCPDELRDD